MNVANRLSLGYFAKMTNAIMTGSLKIQLTRAGYQSVGYVRTITKGVRGREISFPLKVGRQKNTKEMVLLLTR